MRSSATPHNRDRTQNTRQPKASIPSKRSADTQEEAWVADEDRFVLQQAKKKAAIRIKGGRARPIDWLAALLGIIDPTKNPADDEDDEHELDIVDPEGVLEGLSDKELAELEKDIDTYITLETNRENKEYWNTFKIICNDRQRKNDALTSRARGSTSVSSDIDKLLGPKTYEQLETLEAQIKRKLNSNEPIDYDYWEQLLRSLVVWKAKAKLRRVSRAIVASRLNSLRKQQSEDASIVSEKLRRIIADSAEPPIEDSVSKIELQQAENSAKPYSLDPEPLLKLRPEDKLLSMIEEKEFLENIREERRKVEKLGFVPMAHRILEKPTSAVITKVPELNENAPLSRFSAIPSDDFSQATTALYEREVARGVNENEEIFASEEDVITASKSQWANKYRPRKPRYFNRVQMGYEWNKYNQTHYDHDNPPPKVVQGYKFNIFYPDLIDKTKAPIYEIEREHGRKRGQSFAPAGEEDTCLIRFKAGPPYEDVAFRIVDKEWDYSAKRERGFKSSFDKGILQLHFQFKKIYYRK